MLIYSHTITNRTRYIMNLLFNDMMGITTTLTDNPDIFKQAQGPRLAYGFHRFTDDAIFIEASGILFESGIKELNPRCFEYQDQKFLFPGNGDLPFDIFSGAFYLLTRSEEYLPSEKDKYG